MHWVREYTMVGSEDGWTVVGLGWRYKTTYTAINRGMGW